MKTRVSRLRSLSGYISYWNWMSCLRNVFHLFCDYISNGYKPILCAFLETVDLEGLGHLLLINRVDILEIAKSLVSWMRRFTKHSKRKRIGAKFFPRNCVMKKFNAFQCIEMVSSRSLEHSIRDSQCQNFHSFGIFSAKFANCTFFRTCIYKDG